MYVIKEVGGCGGQMMMFDDKVGRWGWLNADVIKKYTRKKTWFACAEKKVGIFLKKHFFMQWRPGIAVSVTKRHCVSSLSRDMLNHELPSLSPVSMPIINIKTYLKSIYPFEDITDQFNSSD
jgi:hypothetical protein